MDFLAIDGGRKTPSIVKITCVFKMALAYRGIPCSHYRLTIRSLGLRAITKPLM